MRATRKMTKEEFDAVDNKDGSWTLTSEGHLRVITEAELDDHFEVEGRGKKEKEK